MTEQAEQPVLRVENLAISYATRRREIRAVRDVSFEVKKGEIYGLVGESGSGKSTVAFGIVGFLGRNGWIKQGSIVFQGRDLTSLSEKELRAIRGDRIAIVYQDPSQALNPSIPIGGQLREVLEIHRGMNRKEATRRCVEMLRRVHIPDPEVVMARFPHQLSGGQQQRVVIAMALLSDPDLLIMDEPTTALDVTVEAAVLDLVEELSRETDAAVVYITHDLGVVARLCDSVGVMYAGQMVERTDVETLFSDPKHPYSLGLMRCLPALGRSKETARLSPIEGHVPHPDRLPSGCAFEPRCEFAQKQCRMEEPALRVLSPGHFSRCHLAEEIGVQSGAAFRGPKKVGSSRPDDRDDASEASPILRVEGLKTYYEQRSGTLAKLLGAKADRVVKAVDGISVDVPRGVTLGIVGESGCGKSTFAKTLAGLEESTGGTAELLGVDITQPVDNRSFDLIRQLQMVFQNPDSTLNPSFSVGYQIARPLRKFGIAKNGSVKEEVLRILKAVRLNESYYNRLPSQLSGGEKQRAALARAVAARPELLICDEPLSALDVSVQAAILNLFVDLQAEYEITMLFIAHDLSVVRFISDYVAVMYLGHICEIGPAEEIYKPPYHPYTEALLSAVPIPDPTAEQKHIRLSGQVPSALDPPKGCPFHTRCPHKIGEICEKEAPPARNAGGGHTIHCHIPLEELREMEPVVHQSPKPEGGAAHAESP